MVRRSDAQRNLDALLEAAKEVLAAEGVDAPAKRITDRAGVGVGTLYRHFPQRSDLVIAVLEHEIDACAAAGPQLAASRPAGTALAMWVRRYTELVATKAGLASALQAGDTAHQQLRVYFYDRMTPVLDALIRAAAQTGEARPDVRAEDILHAVALLSRPVPGEDASLARRLVDVFLAGLRP